MSPRNTKPKTPSVAETREGLVKQAFEMFGSNPPTYNQLHQAYLAISGRTPSVGAMVEFSMTFSQMSYDAKIQAIPRVELEQARPETYRLRQPTEMVRVTLYTINREPVQDSETAHFEHYEAIESRLTPVKFAPHVREALTVDFEAHCSRNGQQGGRHAVEVEEVDRPCIHEHTRNHYA